MHTFLGIEIRPVVLVASFTLFLIGILFTCGAIVRGQDVTTNAEKIGQVEGQVSGIQREMSGIEKSIDSVPEQVGVMRDRQTRLEGKVDSLISKLNYILGLMGSTVAGVAGLFGSELLKWVKGRAGLSGTDSGAHVLVTPR